MCQFLSASPPFTHTSVASAFFIPISHLSRCNIRNFAHPHFTTARIRFTVADLGKHELHDSGDRTALIERKQFWLHLRIHQKPLQ